MFWRLFKKRLVVGIFVFLCILLVLYLLNGKPANKSSEVNGWWLDDAPCEHTPSVEADMYKLLDKLNGFFEELGLVHFICYGSLWGAIRYSQILPFDRDIDICVVYDDELQQSSLQNYEIIGKLKEKHPDLYILHDSNANIHNVYLNRAMGEIVWFRKHGKDTVVRAISRFDGVDTLDSFPSQYILNLKNIKLGALANLPAPDSSIMKFWYPTTYEREVKPPNCF